MTGTYNETLVALSFFVSVLVGYCTLEFSTRARTSSRVAHRLWLTAGALTAGTGIWSIHFIGMLAFQLPIKLGYDYFLTLLSWGMSVAASGASLILIQRASLTPLQGIASAVLMGGAISGMHYIGIAAMEMSPAIVWRWSMGNPPIFNGQQR